MHFEYEITAEEYASAQSLYHRLSGGRKRIHTTFVWIFAGSFFIVVAWNQRPFDWAQFLLVIVGVWWIYSGLINLFLPAKHFRQWYRASELAGKTFRAEVNEEGFDTRGDMTSSRVRWQGLKLKGENKGVFVFYSVPTIFIFGKQYLTDEQQNELRRLAGLGH